MVDDARGSADGRLSRYRAIFDSAVDFAIIASDCDGLITDWNTGAATIFGWSAEEMIRQRADRFFTSEDRAQGRVEREMTRALEAGRGNDERWHLRKDGARFWANGEMMPLRDGGVHIGFLKIVRDETAKREDAEKRRTDQDFMDSVLAASDDCIKVLDLDANLVFMSEGGKRVMEIDDFNAVRGCSWPSFWQGNLNAEAKDAVAAARAGQAGHFQGRTNTFRGTPKWWDVRVTPILGVDGRPEKILAISRDITLERRAANKLSALLELGDRLRDCATTPEMAFAAAEVLGRLLDVDRAGYALIDLASETLTVERDWTAPSVTSLVGTHRLRDYGSYVDDLKKGETVIFADAAHDPRTSSRGEALAGIAAKALVNVPTLEHGGLAALCFVAQATPRDWRKQEVNFVREVADRTQAAIQRQRAEEALRQLAASLEAEVTLRTADRNRLWQLSTDIMLVAGFDGIITAVNPGWEWTLGWTEHDLVGHSLFDLIHPGDLEDSIAGAKGLSEGELLARFENRYRHKDGSYRAINWTAVPGDGLINAVGRDMTVEREKAEALRATEEQLRQSQKMEAVGQLTGGVAHDFNNLLTGITGSLDLLQKRVAQGRVNDLDRYIIAAQGAAKRAAALTHRLLAFSRRQTLDPKPTDVVKLIIGMADLIRRTVGPEITVETVDMVGLWTALVDPPQLENALLNLCINARDAMPDGGRITIETANKWMDERSARERDLPPGQYLSLCVSDTGTGMTPEVIARACDPFFTTKPLGQGTGLGLSMIYGFARQSGGQVRIYSEVGDGTMVCIYLPRHYGAEDVPDAPADRRDTPRAEVGETVLVVDDEPTVRMLVSDVLSDLGYAALEAKDGPSGLKILQSGTRVDLLVTDVGLPGGMNGRQIADAARVLRPGLKVLFITGYAENAVIGNGHLDPGMAVLTKPFNMDDLAGRIRELITG